MISILKSTAEAESPLFEPKQRAGRESNLTWLQRVLDSPEGYRESKNHTHLLLIGGNNRTAFRLRVAQGQIRDDLSPSHWSHAALLGVVEPDLAETPVYEISLEPQQGFGFPPPENGVQVGQLGQYRNRNKYPNIALMNIVAPVGTSADPDKSFLEQLLDMMEQFKGQRAVLDALELTLQWLAYAWGTGHTDNPLLDGVGMPSAAMLEMVFGAVGYDLTPGLESRASCPEAIWQAAKWWHPFYEDRQQEACHGAYYIGQRL